MQRFWSKVNKTETCWNWIASTRGNGYGCIKYNGKVIDAHRMVWFLTYNQWPKFWVLHKCDNRKCVNPEHLFEGTYKDNINDAMEKGRLARKYFTLEQKQQAKRLKYLRAWHRRGKFRREERKQEYIKNNIAM